MPGTGFGSRTAASACSSDEGHANARPRQAAVPHHHPGVRHQGRQAGRDLRRDGRRHAAAGPLQVFSRIVDYGQNPQAAIDSPRFARADKTVWVEEHMPAEHGERPRGQGPQAHALQVAELRLRLQPDHLALPRGRPLPRRLRKPPRRRGRRVLMVLLGTSFLPRHTGQDRGPRARCPLFRGSCQSSDGCLPLHPPPRARRVVSHHLHRQRRLRPQRRADLRRPLMEGPSHRRPAVQQPHGQRHRRRREPGDPWRLVYADGDWDAERAHASSLPPSLPIARATCCPFCLNIQGGSPQGYFLAPAVEDRRLHGRRHDQARLGGAPRQGHQGLRRPRHGGDPRPVLRSRA